MKLGLVHFHFSVAMCKDIIYDPLIEMAPSSVQISIHRKRRPVTILFHKIPIIVHVNIATYNNL